MRKIIISFLLLLTIATLVKATEQDSLFASAQQQYAQGNYQKAYHLYDGLIREGYHSAHLFYNFANVCIQLDQPAKAIAYYEKSLRYHPKDVDIKNNLAFARKQIGVTDIQENSIWAHVDERILYVISIFLIWAAILLICYLFLLKQKSERGKWYWASFIVGSFAVFAAIQSALIFQHRHLKVFAIAQDEVIMYKSPAKFSTEVYDIFSGQKVEILQSRNEWSEVKTERNKRGWVHSSGLIQL